MTVTGTEANTEVLDALALVRSRDIDREFLAQSQLNVVERPRVSAFPWRGQFTPGLIETLLRAYAPARGTILDPFAGSGTTLIEGIRWGLDAIGAEVNPAAVELSSVFTLAQLEPVVRETTIGRLRRKLSNAVLSGGPDGVPEKDLLAAMREVHASCESKDEARLAAVTTMLAMGDSATLTRARLRKALRSVAATVQEFPRRVSSCRVYGADARDLPIADDAVDIVITSPPYINVFNYHQNYRKAVEFLGWDVLPAARSEIGSNRKHRRNRFRTVIQYCMDMQMALNEMIRVCRSNAPVVIVVGRESRVRGVPFPNGDIIATLAEMTRDLRFTRWQERSFLNRFGEIIYEEILSFEVDKPGAAPAPAGSRAAAAELGRQLLISARRSAPSDEVRDEIDDAIASTSKIAPSPPLKLARREDRVL